MKQLGSSCSDHLDQLADLFVLEMSFFATANILFWVTALRLLELRRLTEMSLFTGIPNSSYAKMPRTLFSLQLYDYSSRPVYVNLVDAKPDMHMDSIVQTLVKDGKSCQVDLKEQRF